MSKKVDNAASCGSEVRGIMFLNAINMRASEMYRGITAVYDIVFDESLVCHGVENLMKEGKMFMMKKKVISRLSVITDDLQSTFSPK